ncbi:CHASE2 domain-containing protein [Flammeovirgaceae bacterium SG7u.111]|nr:CHASE2 domain-containing protein [Flammeovirgaceae bacterium SG7u.132]WPO37683.1 CHASE2 domain-containing protein [Flammeovirgaceae bacterium SG7u.111]
MGKKIKSMLGLGVSMLHALFLIIVTLVYLSLPFTLDDEVVLIQVTAAVKNKLLKQKRKPDRDRFMFVNVSWDKQLIDRIDTNGIPLGNQAITNRESLAKLLNVFNQKPDNHKFLLIDVNFLDPSPHDAALQKEFLKIKNCVMSYHKDAKGKPVYPIIKGPLGLSDMIVDDEEKDLVLKYHLIQGDSLKTTPLLMYETIHGKKYEKGFLFDKIGDSRIFNSFVLDHPVDNFDVFKNNEYNYYYINELLFFPPEVIQEFAKDRIVIVGDFEDQDIHNTIYGKTPGPIVLVNAFLALEYGDNIISPYFLLLLFIAFTLISYKALTVRDPVTVFVEKKFAGYNFVVEMTVDVTFYLVYFGLISIISYVFFQIHLTILFLSFYMNFLEMGIVALDKRKKEKKEKKLAAANKEPKNSRGDDEEESADLSEKEK